MIRISPLARMTFGLVSLALLVLLALDLLGGFAHHPAPDRADYERRARLLAVQLAELVRMRETVAMDRTLAAVLSHDPDLASVTLRRSDGVVLASGGEPPARALAGDTPLSSGPVVSVDLIANERPWGQLQMFFKPRHGEHLRAWQGVPALLAAFALLTGLLFHLYLRQVLRYLDPRAAVPDRIQQAFDAFSSAVLLVDRCADILLANEAALRLVPADQASPLVGTRMTRLQWLSDASGAGGTQPPPWRLAMDERRPVRGMPFVVHRDGSCVLKVTMNCSPLLDAGEVRGCLVTLDDVTALEQAHRQLVEFSSALEQSRNELNQKNVELLRLATRDSLTGVLNRHALFERMAQCFSDHLASGRPLACVMADIDHFKQINDRHGHGVGDRAIRRFADIMAEQVGDRGLVGRYGGEEFCVLLPDSGPDDAWQWAERMRAALQADRSVAGANGLPLEVTASFGLASALAGAQTPAQLVHQADEALYLAKRRGRNRVATFSEAVACQPSRAEAFPTSPA